MVLYEMTLDRPGLCTITTEHCVLYVYSFTYIFMYIVTFALFCYKLLLVIFMSWHIPSNINILLLGNDSERAFIFQWWKHKIVSGTDMAIITGESFIKDIHLYTYPHLCAIEGIVSPLFCTITKQCFTPRSGNNFPTDVQCIQYKNRDLRSERKLSATTEKH